MRPSRAKPCRSGSGPLIECCAPISRTSLTLEEAIDLEELFKVLSDRHRVQIVNMLARSDEAVCGCQLEPALGVAQPTVSYHLKLLTESGLVERESRGRFGYYRLCSGALDRLRELMSPARVSS